MLKSPREEKLRHKLFHELSINGCRLNRKALLSRVKQELDTKTWEKVFAANPSNKKLFEILIAFKLHR